MLKEAQRLAKMKGGKCLSTSYKNAHEKLTWQCSCGYIWEANFNKIKSGRWCHKCGGSMKLNIEYMHSLAAQHNGKCLSKEYINSKTKLTWQCSCGYIWDEFYGHIKAGCWCPKCSGRRHTIDDMIDLAEKRGGKCLSEKYVNAKTKLQWRCKFGHIWFAVPNNIKNGRWCPECGYNVSEDICRLYFEAIFGYKFIKIRPDWLKNNTGYNLELDGYCAELKLAFEHNGEQHFNDCYNTGELEIIQRYDKLKLKLCAENNVKLIVIPELFTYTKDLKEHIKQECKKLNIILPPNYDEIKIDHNKIYAQAPRRQKEYDAIVKIIESKGGKCLSETYINAQTKILVRCKNGHEWETYPGNIKNGHWCWKCRCNTISDAKKAAEERKGWCLSEKQNDYVIKETEKIPFKCGACEHVWETTMQIIGSGSWCPECRFNRKSIFKINDAREIAKSKGGTCLSEFPENYMIRNKDKLKFICVCGNEWETTSGLIKAGSWCPKCSTKYKRKINVIKKASILEEFKQIAISKGGKCLSETYINSQNKLKFICSNNHQFESFPSSIKNGSWCAKCIKTTILDLRMIAKEKGGECLSEKHDHDLVSKKEKVPFKCGTCGNIWHTESRQINHGSWCPKCAKKIGIRAIMAKRLSANAQALQQPVR